jgi:hypothetical protein
MNASNHVTIACQKRESGAGNPRNISERSAPLNGSPPSESGSVAIITAGILAVVGSITFAVVKLGVTANDRARAQAVADLGSLAGASADLATANRVVASNGGVMLRASESGESVELSVAVGSAQAQAVAERTYVSWNPVDFGPGAVDDLETTTIATMAPTTTRALVYITIPAPVPTTRALIFVTIPTPTSTKKPTPTAPPKLAPVPGTSPRR